ncbi:hypothetical protein DXV76_15675 [Rhodobacteraceae bacterium CCMM004]|nr:hypothetical protein DXV76_15675 [Rhodobacteraceae bacterium CCMM004]
MRFVTLIAELKLAEARLRTAMTYHGSTRFHAKLLRRCATLMDAVENHTPDSADELNEQIAFFLRRASDYNGGAIADRSMEIVVRLMNAFPNGAPQDGRSLALEALEDVCGEDGISAYITGSLERLVAIDTGFRYLAVSQPNAQFNRNTQAGMVSMHLEQVIGRERYVSRARRRLELCFNGQAQEYYYPVAVADRDRRVIRCQMKPVYDNLGQLYCGLMYMHDVTGHALNRSRQAAVSAV